MDIVVAPNDPPESWTSSIFLAGPTPRKEGDTRWRDEAIAEFKKLGYDGVFLDPERDDWPDDPAGYKEQVEWEQEMRERADVILFWIPRDIEKAPAFTTNVEFGVDYRGWKAIYGRPNDAEKMDYLDFLYHQRYKVAAETTLKATVQAAMDMIETLTEKANALKIHGTRSGGETYVPLHVWSTPQFQDWYNAQLEADNRLDAARVEYAFVMPKAGLLFMFVLWVKVWIEDEQRFKENEFIVSRTDISSIVAYRYIDDGENAEVILVQEFRSPVRNESGFVYECPGGSSIKPGQDPLEVAADELFEETGLRVAAERFTEVQSKQLVATMLTHHAHLFAVELTEDEIVQVKKMDHENQTHGLDEDSEKTYVRVVKASQLYQYPVDWSTVGMIATVVGKVSP